jgi:hypothetical protein
VRIHGVVFFFSWSLKEVKMELIVLWDTSIHIYPVLFFFIRRHLATGNNWSTTLQSFVSQIVFCFFFGWVFTWSIQLHVSSCVYDWVDSFGMQVGDILWGADTPLVGWIIFLLSFFFFFFSPHLFFWLPIENIAYDKWCGECDYLSFLRFFFS